MIAHSDIRRNKGSLRTKLVDFNIILKAEHCAEFNVDVAAELRK